MRKPQSAKTEAQPAEPQTEFEAFVSAILKVPKDEIVEAEDKRVKRVAQRSKRPKS